MATKARMKTGPVSVLRARLWADDGNTMSVKERAVRDANQAFQKFAHEVGVVRRVRSRPKMKMKHA